MTLSDAAFELGHSGRGQHLAVAFADALGQSLADLLVVDDTRLGDMDRLDPGRVRLQLLESVRADDLAGHAVGLASLEDPLHRRQLGVIERHDHLAADLVGDPLRGAELLHQLLALATVDRLERAGLVVDPRVQHARVVAGLVEGQPSLFLQHHDLAPGEFPGELVGGRQADDPPTDDGHVRRDHCCPWICSCRVLPVRRGARQFDRIHRRAWESRKPEIPKIHCVIESRCPRTCSYGERSP